MNVVENAPRGLALAGLLMSSSASNEIDRAVTPQWSSTGSAATPDPASDPRLSTTTEAVDALMHRSRTMRDIAPIRSSAVEATRHLLDALLEGAIQAHLPWLAPHIATEGCGDVTLRWSGRSDRSLSLHVTGVGPVEFLQAWGADPRGEMADGPLRSDVHLIELWRWLHED